VNTMPGSTTPDVRGSRGRFSFGLSIVPPTSTVSGCGKVNSRIEHVFPPAVSPGRPVEACFQPKHSGDPVEAQVGHHTDMERSDSVRREGHVIVCGLQGVGLRTVEQLHQAGVGEVVDDEPDPRPVRILEAWGIRASWGAPGSPPSWTGPPCPRPGRWSAPNGPRSRPWRRRWSSASSGRTSGWSWSWPTPPSGRRSPRSPGPAPFSRWPGWPRPRSSRGAWAATPTGSNWPAPGSRPTRWSSAGTPPCGRTSGRSPRSPWCRRTAHRRLSALAATTWSRWATR
jgi:hypothetical protein